MMFYGEIYNIFLMCYSARIIGVANISPFAFPIHTSFPENMLFHTVPGRGSNPMHHVILSLPWLTGHMLDT